MNKKIDYRRAQDRIASIGTLLRKHELAGRDAITHGNKTDEEYGEREMFLAKLVDLVKEVTSNRAANNEQRAQAERASQDSLNCCNGGHV